MAVNYELHETAPDPIAETRDRFVRSALWNCPETADTAVRAAFDRLANALQGTDLAVTMFQSSPSGNRTEYALVLHHGPRVDQRRYFRPEAVVDAAAWETRRDRRERVPYTSVVEALGEWVGIAHRSGSTYVPMSADVLLVMGRDGVEQDEAIRRLGGQP